MSENPPVEPGPEPTNQPPSSGPTPINDWRDQRDQWREQRREERREARRMYRAGWGGWIWGVVLILIGVVFLLQNAGFTFINNWWALFILIPALGALGTAYTSYRAAGNRLTAPARGSLLGGVLMLMVTFIFLFSLNWSLLWPVLVILAGIGLLINAMLPG